MRALTALFLLLVLVVGSFQDDWETPHATAARQSYNFGFIHTLLQTGPFLPLNYTKFAERIKADYPSAINSITLFDATNNNLTLSNLSGIDAVLVWSDNQFEDAQTLGNVLSDYVDAGGGVVIGMFANGPYRANEYPKGLFAEKYRVIIPLGFTGTYNLDPNWVWDGHPIMQGVTNITAGFLPDVGTNITEGSYVVARYQGGPIAVAVKDAVGPASVNRVDLGLWPIDFYYLPFAEQAYADIMVQSLIYTISDSYLITNQATCVVPNFATLLRSNFTVPSNATFTQSSLEGTTLTKGTTTQVTVTVSVAGLGVLSRTEVLTCNPSSSPSSGLFEFSLWSFFLALFL